MIFSGMLAGQMLSRHAGWGDLQNVPFDSIVSSMREQLVAQVGPSYNFYAPKVFNLTSNAGAVDPRNSAGGKATP